MNKSKTNWGAGYGWYDVQDGEAAATAHGALAIRCLLLVRECRTSLEIATSEIASRFKVHGFERDYLRTLHRELGKPLWEVEEILIRSGLENALKQLDVPTRIHQGRRGLLRSGDRAALRITPAEDLSKNAQIYWIANEAKRHTRATLARCVRIDRRESTSTQVDTVPFNDQMPVRPVTARQRPEDLLNDGMPVGPETSCHRPVDLLMESLATALSSGQAAMLDAWLDHPGESRAAAALAADLNPKSAGPQLSRIRTKAKWLIATDPSFAALVVQCGYGSAIPSRPADSETIAARNSR